MGKWFKAGFLIVMVMLVFSACSRTANTDMENAPIDYREAVEHAQSEFLMRFSELEKLEITETSTAARPDDSGHIVIRFSYSSKSGDGAYGIEMREDGNGNYEILQQGEDITMDVLVNGSAN